MTKQEFIARQRALNDISIIRTVIWIAVFLGTMIGGAVLAGFIESLAELTWLGPVLGVSFGVIMLGIYGLLLWFVIRRHKRLGHRCPACGKALGQFLAQIAIATDHCGHCGKSVFEEEKPG